MNGSSKLMALGCAVIFAVMLGTRGEGAQATTDPAGRAQTKQQGEQQQMSTGAQTGVQSKETDPEMRRMFVKDMRVRLDRIEDNLDKVRDRMDNVSDTHKAQYRQSLETLQNERGDLEKHIDRIKKNEMALNPQSREQIRQSVDLLEERTYNLIDMIPAKK